MTTAKARKPAKTSKAKAAKPRLVLHIGTHKTATSTLQAMLSDSRTDLAAQGFLYPRTDRSPVPSRRKHAFLSRLLHHGGADFTQVWDEVMAELAASGCHTLVMSGEGLSGPALRPDPAALARVAADCDVTVVCFLRRQDYFAESLWNQRCKVGRQTTGIGHFVRAEKTRTHMDYASMLAAWSAAGTVAAVGFEAAREIGVSAAFSQASGVPLPEAPRDHNISPSMTCAAAMAAMNRLGLGHDWERLEAVLSADGPLQRRALGRNLRRALLDDYAACNATLRDKFGVTFPDDLPDEGDDPLRLPPEAEARRMARRMNRTRARLS